MGHIEARIGQRVQDRTRSVGVRLVLHAGPDHAGLALAGRHDDNLGRLVERDGAQADRHGRLAAGDLDAAQVTGSSGRTGVVEVHESVVATTMIKKDPIRRRVYGTYLVVEL